MSVGDRTLTDADVAALVDALAARLPGVGSRPLTTEGVCDLLGVSRDFVYEHAAELGAYRPGGGGRAPLRFDATEVLAARERWRVQAPAPAPAPAPRPRRGGRPATAAGVDLLPIRDDLR